MIEALIFSPKFALAFYALAVIVTLGIAKLSKNPALIIVATLLAVSCIGSNLLLLWLGPANQPWADPSLQALIAVFTGGVFLERRSRVAALVSGLFVLELLIIVIYILAHKQGTGQYFLSINLVFLAQLVITGGAGCVELYNRAVERGSVVFHQRPGLREHSSRVTGAQKARRPW